MSRELKKELKKRRKRKKKHNIRNFIITLSIVSLGGVGLYAHFGGDEAKAYLSEIKVQVQTTIYETGEKIGLAKPVSEFIQWAQEVWDKFVPDAKPEIELADIPEYAGAPFVEINGNVPEFDESDFEKEAFERYSSLDILSRCGAAYAKLGKELMPKEERGSISEVKPTGWQNVKYEGIDQGYLYNRCHLIGFQLAGENANEKNLITGTRYMNVEGMLPLENMVASYIRETGNHVMYRVTPVYNGADMVARGVQIEAESVEDDGAGIYFNVYCYNVQPGIEIDYATGASWEKCENMQNRCPESKFRQRFKNGLR